MNGKLHNKINKFYEISRLNYCAYSKSCILIWYLVTFFLILTYSSLEFLTFLSAKYNYYIGISFKHEQVEKTPLNCDSMYVTTAGGEEDDFMLCIAPTEGPLFYWCILH